jgi:hypothetical protein
VDLKAIRAAGLVVLLAAVAAGCDHGPQKAAYAHPVPSCAALQAVVAQLGMPDPQVEPSTLASSETNRVDCSWNAGDNTASAAVASASVLVIRPEVKTGETDPVKLFGEQFAADGSLCKGQGEDDPALPHGKRCAQLFGEHQALVTVSTYAKSAGITIIVRYFDPSLASTPVRLATQDKANSLAKSTIDLL